MRKQAQACTWRQAVVLKDLTEDQFIGVQGEWISEHADWDEVHVTVGAFGLVCAGTIKVPLWNIWKDQFKYKKVTARRYVNTQA